MINPHISIIIATYNSGKTLRIALESVKNQTYQNWECLIIDGASKDETLNIVKEYVQMDSRFRYISEPDEGIFDAFNKGWKQSNGKWIYYLGSDDSLNKEAFEKIDFNNADEYDVIYGNIAIVFPNGTIKFVHPLSPDKLKYLMFANHQSILTKKEKVEGMGGFNIQYSISADFDLMQRIYLSGSKFKYIDVCIATFSYAGLSSMQSEKKKKDHYLIIKNNKANYCPWGFHKLIELRKYLGYLYKKYIEKSI